MARRIRIKEQHIALFGGSGSGKTVLLSSFFGPTQEGDFDNGLWDLIADDTTDGNIIHQRYLGMRDDAELPAATSTNGKSYSFTMRLKGHADTAKQPFDALRLVWHDYPGEWFEQEPQTDTESGRRVKTFRKLLTSDVGFLLVDGQKLLQYTGEEERYLKALFTSFRQGFLRLQSDILTEGPLVRFPRIWTIALSKADLLPGMDVLAFRDLIIRKAAGELASLRSTIGEFVQYPEALSVGDDFALLSSAKFELAPDNQPLAIDVSRRIGVDLVLPLATILPLEHRARWEQKFDFPRKVLNRLASRPDLIAAAIAAAEKRILLLAFKAGGPKAAVVAMAAGSLLQQVANVAGERLRETNEAARANGNYLAAALTQFKIDLEEGRAAKILLSSPK